MLLYNNNNIYSERIVLDLSYTVDTLYNINPSVYNYIMVNFIYIYIYIYIYMYIYYDIHLRSYSLLSPLSPITSGVQ